VPARIRSGAARFCQPDWCWLSYLPAIEHGRNEGGAEVLLAISREFEGSLGWLLTGEE